MKMNRAVQFASLVGTLMLACLLSVPALAGQRRPPKAPPNSSQGSQELPKNNPNNNARGGGNNNPRGGGNNGGITRKEMGLPPRFVERLQAMSPEQQEHFLKNNERFKNMNAQQQANIRRRLQHWNSLSPEQRIMWRQRQAALEQMTPQERQYVSQQLLPRLQNTPPARRMVLLDHVRQLEGLNDSDLSAKLRDPAFIQGLSPEEQEMIPYLHRLHWGSAQEPPPGPPEY